MKIWKYEVPISDTFTIEMPSRAKIISFQVQNDKPCIWALCNPESELKNRYFSLYGTGHEIINYNEALSKYIGTIQMLNDKLVWHLFEDLL